jgi:IS5 family transposase
MASRYAHAKQFKRHHHQLRLLRSRLGRIIRDIRRNIAGRPVLEAAFEAPLVRAAQIRSQQQRQRGRKLYSFHAPEVECIGKGKASAPYEFGVKASIVTTNARAPAGQSVLHARALPGNPYDGHTLGSVIEAARSSAPMSTRAIAATTRPIRVASSSLVRSVVSSAPSSANCGGARRSNRSSDT